MHRFQSYLRLCGVFATGVIFATGAFAQEFDRRATFMNGGSADRGKCTIEVVVDGAAEVHIRGDRAALRNLSGRPATWRRFECTGPLPANPSDFRFAGVDGRGRQELMRDPRNGGGTAVVRIEDPQGGSEGYTFDLFWGGGYNSGPAYPPGRPGGRWGREEAVRGCQEAIREEAAQRFRGRVEILDGRIDDNPGRNDWVIGRLSTPRGEMRYSCSVDFQSGRVRSAAIDFPEGGEAGSSRAVETCRQAVQDRIRRDGFGRVEFTSLRVDDNPGRRDWVIGTVNAYRGPNFQSYNVSCSVDLRSGEVRNVEVRPR
jgi:hypothetical protein